MRVATPAHIYSQVQPLKLPLQLKWRHGPDMPFRMSTSIQSVQVQGTLYVGGGYAGAGDSAYTVMAYDIGAGKWATLPPYSTCYFAMTVIDNHLVLVGGRGRHYSESNILGVWRASSKEWTYPYPDMATPRRSCSAVTYKLWLAVMGGMGDGGRLSSVEVMNTDTKQWYDGPPTPIAWTEMKTAIVGDMCYFMGGYVEGTGYTDKVYNVSLPALVSQLSSAKDTQTWKEMLRLPVTHAAPLSISGTLVAVGGLDKDGKALSALHLYQPDAGQWIKVADMPIARYHCTSIMTTELVVAGGYHKGRWLATMYTAQIC